MMAEAVKMKRIILTCFSNLRFGEVRVFVDIGCGENWVGK